MSARAPAARMQGMDDHANTTTAPHPTPPGNRAGERRLVRRVDGRWLGGVCAGLGEHFDLDPIVFRLGFVALALLGGIGLVVYVLAWIFIPAADGPAPARASSPRGSSVDRARSQITGFPALAGLLILVVGLALIGRGIGLRVSPVD